MSELLPTLRRLFGFDEFRPGQEQVVRAAIEGRDTLALMPTGSGKSLTYQLAAMLRPTPTLVLSPLIALMKDQVDGLPPEVAAQATFVNSSLPPEETAVRLAGFRAGETRLLYAAPERLRSAGFLDALRGVGVGLVVVDEVHCVSMWGHDFRPDYLFIRRALEELGGPALLGMTATASPDTAREIATALGRDPEVVRTSVVRPNLRYDVERVDGREGRVRAVLAALARAGGGSAIVYARSRESCERLARTLRGHGIGAEHYHAGLESTERTRVQDDFIAGETQVVVATTAFGMGIDKPDVRLVALVNFPDSLETYVQMVGRAGRDGAPSETLLVASPQDAVTLRRFVREDVPSLDELRAVYRALGGGGAIEPEALAGVVGERRDPRVLVGMLEQAGLVRRGFDSGRAMRVEVLPPPADAADRIASLLERYGREAVARAERIVGFADAGRCRHAQVAEHFGEQLDGPCGSCDVCDAPARLPDRAAASAPPLPEDAGRAISGAVAGLRWPLGRRSLTAMLRGSVEAPPSARRAEAFGILAAASEADVRRWLGHLLAAGTLAETETEDGFRVIVTVPGVEPPAIRTGAGAPADAGLVELLRGWRRERSRTDGVPAYVVLHDATLDELAAVRPTSLAELGRVKGFGPVKVERYGEDLLAVLEGAAG
ncbi:MAG TPA: ATP-dependent DNA helicase RecQ [Gaiellaceae bacterium]|nr:ATP-dependent DNA helicase RecQ [Gaiellaceae bacterium]